jgi:hypothetical protein
MVKLRLNDQEMDMVIGGLERLVQSLDNVEYQTPVTALMNRLIAEWENTKNGSGNCCGGC